MRKSRAAIHSALLCLALAGAGVSRADTPPAAPATQPGAASPEQIFKDRGLTRMGLFLILPGETDVHAGVQKLKSAKAKVMSDTLAHHDMDAAIKRGTDTLNDMTTQYAALSDQYQRQFGGGSPTNANSNTAQYNQWVMQENNFSIRLKTAAQNILLQQAQLDDLKKRQSESGNSRSTYISVAIDVGTTAETVAAGYAKLAADAELSSAIVQYNQTNHTRAKLGPSGIFLEDLPYVRQCAKDVTTGDVPVRKTESGGLMVQAVLNGKVTDQMVWDSGADEVVLSTATAKALNLKPSSGDATIEIGVADGRAVKAKVMMLDSIRVGSFTAKDVPCVVLPPGSKTEDLLGNPFQRRFISKLDQQAGTLQLTPIDLSVTHGPATDSPAQPPAADPAHAGG